MRAFRAYDAVTVGNIPTHPWPEVVMGYLAEQGEHFPTLPELIHTYHGHSRIVSIGLYEESLCDLLDVEPGNPVTLPIEVRRSWQHRREHGIERPGYYGDLTRMREVILPGLAGLPRHEYRLVLADWNGIGAIPPGYDGIQYLANGRYDLSELAGDFFDTAKSAAHAAVGPRRHSPLRKTPQPHRHHPVNGGRQRSNPPLRLHRKVTAATGGGSLGIAVAAVLSAFGIVHITPAESASLSTLLALVFGWTTPAPSR